MKFSLSLAVGLVCCVAASAQQATDPTPPKPTAQSEAGEPRAGTSTTAAPAKPAKGSAQTEAGEPRANTSAPSKPNPNAGSPAPPKKGPTQTDRLELGTATVTGDREQPKVMYVVPWKRSDLGDLAGKPMNSLVDEILSPIDRDEFKREVRYYTTVKSDANQNGAQPPPGQGEK